MKKVLDCKGQSIVEYIFVMSLIVLSMIFVLVSLSDSLTSVIEDEVVQQYEFKDIALSLNNGGFLKADAILVGFNDHSITKDVFKKNKRLIESNVQNILQNNITDNNLGNVKEKIIAILNESLNTESVTKIDFVNLEIY
ncbi:MAG: hypothetical protein ACOCQR_00455 [bacterium]